MSQSSNLITREMEHMPLPSTESGPWPSNASIVSSDL